MNTVNWAIVESAFAILPLPEQLKVVERLIRVVQRPPTNRADEQRAALQHLSDELADLPVKNPQDGFSARDHDRILYGKTK